MSDEAFDALLKPLEEPPPNVGFIMAATNLEITYGKKTLAEDTDVAVNTVRDALDWLLSRGSSRARSRSQVKGRALAAAHSCQLQRALGVTRGVTP